MSTSSKDRYYSSMGKSRRGSPGDSQGSDFFQTGQVGRTVLPPISPASPTSRFPVPATYSSSYTQPHSSPDRYDLNPQAYYPNQWQTSSTSPYDTHERYSPQMSYGYRHRSSLPVIPTPSDSRRLPPLTTSSPGGDRWQQSDYGMPTAHGYPNNICSPTASYPNTYATYPSSNQTSSYSYHLPGNDHHSMGVQDYRSLFDDVDSRDPRSSSPYSRSSGSSQVSAPSYTPPPASPSSLEEPRIRKKRKRVDAAQLKVLNETYNRTAFPSTEERHTLAKALDMSARGVQIWFQNKRQSARQTNRQSSTVSPAKSFTTANHSEPLLHNKIPSGGEETGKREEDGSHIKQAEDTRMGFQDCNSSDCFGHIYCGLSMTRPISAALLPLPDDSVPHSESIQERLRRLDEMDLSESRILLLEKIHEEMWAVVPTIGIIKWDDLPWPVFARTTCPEDLMLHRIVSYLLQVSSGMDIKKALVDSSRLPWAQQRLRILLGHWGQPSLQKKVENSADNTMIQGVNVVTYHLESVLHFVNTHQVDEAHHEDLTTIISQTFLKNVGENLARILTDSSDNSGYKSLLRLEGDSAQKMLNFLQTLLDCSELVSLPRNDILGALLRLSKLSKLYPECLTIKSLERDGDVLDSGRFGEIYKGRSRNQTICLKVIKVNQKTKIKHLLKEALLWGHLSHPNILPFYGIYHLEDTRGRISFVSPWMENGNVTEYLKRHPLANRLLLTRDIVLGIQFLHQNQVIHGDLKGLNVLVNRSGRGCLADFGLANLVDENIPSWTSTETTGHQNGGTLRWQAPELISEGLAKATPASDIYSFACVCYEVGSVVSKTVL
ncbi:uncharacterized protein LACBIDRAFT_297628 [Laccaria bicolor S238N-H82]|uniref:Predicted protein n=1 Tax=Laccaria bicolor (strain S238N-H82 / ATCC MYA-4686) TaxID=486041 RepID=B0DBM7_LACBS|nr:uncharacterized protein LACBIDRAFT_297628 [Laccaria bicolor S238N-H82]EDR08211.1 predicted protein [Laccaria bicolor S238N-H82]|eukprot:XP_001881281.1 predicted protein [Laccaria bicolor S238N-H82]